MRRLVVSRLSQAAIVVALVGTLAFVLIHVAPGDPFGASLSDPSVAPDVRQRLLAQFGYDRPLPEQYVRYVGLLARGELGYSHTLSRPVADVLRTVIPNTLLLMGTALGLGLVAGVALGTWQAARHGTAADRVTGRLTLLLLSTPEFLLALAALSLFAARWRLFPVGGMVDPAMHDGYSFVGRAFDIAQHLALPASTLAAVIAAGVSRYHRSEMLGVLPEEFIRTARAKGAGERAVLWRHAFPNAVGSVIALCGLLLPALFGGTVFVETIFSWPGMGLTTVNAVAGRDYQLVVAAVLIGSVMVAAGSAAADLLAALADPRSRRQA